MVPDCLSRCVRTVLLMLMFGRGLSGYSVLSHEAIVDSLWDGSIKPLLLRRFPDAGEEDLRKAHAYAYGGCILQDMGYYPFGSKLFSDLTHYVRSGDFVASMIANSQNLHEYAFALGSLAHYASDNNGHRLAINRAVPLLYPNLKRKYGNSVAYADDPVTHMKTEFGFDVLQVARGRYATDHYHSFIGFEVSKSLLERAFLETYALEAKDVFGNLDLALGTYRRAVGSILPEMTKVAWNLKKDEVQKEVPSITRKRFIFNLSRAHYEMHWGTTYTKPSFRVRFLSFLFRLIPKIGLFKSFSFRMPTPDTERLFMESFNTTVNAYRKLLAAQASAAARISNENLDLGEPTRAAGKYKGSDSAYERLVDHLAARKFSRVSNELRQDILEFYKDLKNSPAAAGNAKTLQQIEELRAINIQTAKPLVLE